ncbi:hypothetical protein ACLQ2R_39070 [Streptosporangium sp. DT93]
MSEVTGTERPPLGTRLLQALVREPDWAAMTAGRGDAPITAGPFH